jgi:hypothetical protein
MFPNFFRRRPRNGNTTYIDLMSIILICVLPLIAQQSKDLQGAQADAASVPKLKDTIEGLRGTVKSLSKGLSDSEKRGSGLRETIGDKDGEIGRMQGIVQGLSGRIGELEDQLRPGDPVTVLILIDVTNSMEPCIRELRVTLSTICEITASLSKDFRVGILAYRDGVVAEFPITPILPKYEDEGKSQAEVLAFVETLHSKPSWTRHLPVFERGMSMLRTAHPQIDPARRERVVLIGDAFTNEIDGKGSYSETERKEAQRIVAGLTKWAQQGNRAVEALYTDNFPDQVEEGETESREWFVALGQVSPQSASYDDSGLLLRAILHASHH